MKTKIIKVSIEQHKKLKQISKRSGMKIQHMTATALQNFIDNNEHLLKEDE